MGKSGNAMAPIIQPTASLESKMAYPVDPEFNASRAIFGISGWDNPQNNRVEDNISKILIFVDLNAYKTPSRIDLSFFNPSSISSDFSSLVSLKDINRRNAAITLNVWTIGIEKNIPVLEVEVKNKAINSGPTVLKKEFKNSVIEFPQVKYLNPTTSSIRFLDAVISNPAVKPMPTKHNAMHKRG